MKNRIRLASTLAFALLATRAHGLDWKYRTDAELAAAVLPSYVNIFNRHVARKDDAAQTAPSAAPKVEDDIGSGVIVSADGLIVTNRHVVENAYALFVSLSDGRRLRATLVLAGTNFDLALIKVDPGDRPLHPAALGDSEIMNVGDRVVAIGNPAGFAASVSAGIISAKHRQLGLSPYDDLIQTDATINRGNSGGPLFNMNGEVVGINQAIFTQNQGGSIGIGFAIPVDDVKRAREGLEKSGTPRLGWLGLTSQPLTEQMAQDLGLGAGRGGGALVAAVKPDSPAARAGMQRGDIVRAVDGEKVADAVALNRKIAVSAGRTLRLACERAGRVDEVAVEIGDFPGNAWITRMAEAPRFDDISDLGATFADRPDADGVEISGVTENSVAWYAGARAGDVIRSVRMKAVRNSGELREAVAALRAAGAPGGVIFVDGPNGPRWLDIDILQ